MKRALITIAMTLAVAAPAMADQALATSKNCMACHAVDKKLVGPSYKDVAAKYAKQFPTLDLVTIDKDFGGWKTAQPKFFNDGGVFDQIYQAQ